MAARMQKPPPTWFGRVVPQWFDDLALQFRIPGFFICYYVWRNTVLFWDSATVHKLDEKGQSGGGKWVKTYGKVLSMDKVKYRFFNVPRYTMTYEFEHDGVRYESTRLSSGTPYRHWMNRLIGTYEVITEQQYLQSIPLFRVGEPCLVYHDKQYPGSYSAVVLDACSFANSYIAFFGFMPLVLGGWLQLLFRGTRQTYFRRKKFMRVRFPKTSMPQPPKPPPPGPVPPPKA